MPWWNPFQREVREDLIEAKAGPAPVRAPARRSGFEHGISQQGLSEYNQGAAISGLDRRSLMTQLYDAFLACPWAWASVNAIARRVTAGDLILEWDNQDGQGGEEPKEKPANVLAFEQLLAYCNARENIRQLIRGIVADLLVFGDAFLEVVWIGKQPVALYSLDSPSMFPVADEHGVITGYVQITEFHQRAEFEPREVIHISLDSPRSGVFGVSPTYAALLPITSWLFTAATLKEIYRKGNPPNIHVDLPGSADESVWLDQYMARNVGSRNIGRPIVTKNGGQVTELQRNGIPELLEVLAQRRDEIVASYGVPPAQVGIIESGNLGGGTGESQQKTFDVITCDPIADLILEALFFALGREGFGIEGWRLAFAEVDLRDSDVVEGIREKRLQNGVWTVNRYRADVGEPTVDGGDDAVLMGSATSNLIRVTDLDASAKAGIAKQVVGTALTIKDTGATGDPVELEKAPEPTPPPAGGPGGPGGPGFPGGPGGSGPDGSPVPPGPQGAGGGKDTRDTDDDPDSFGKDEEEDPEETQAGDVLDEALVDALAAEQVARYIDTTGALWAWSETAGTYERALDPAVAETLAATGVEVYLDEHDAVWVWSVEETRYVRTAAGSKKYGLPIGAPIVPGAKGPSKPKAGGKIAIASKQKTQKATAAHFFPAGGAHGASWDANTSTLDVTDPPAAVAHLDKGIKSHSSTTPVPKIAISALKKKVAALGGGDGDDGQDGASSPQLSPAGTPVNTQPGKLEDFAAIPDVDVNEPPLPDPGPGKRVSTGIIVREPDGRIWILEPKGHFGGYEHTFPKGGIENDGLTPQQNAHKELFEELGLKAKITGYVGDYKGSTGVTRMYVADRTGGTPHPDDPTPYVPGGLEAASIKLVTPGQAEQLLNTKRDKQMLADMLALTGKPGAAAATPTVSGGLISTKDWERVGKQKGSNPGGTFTSPSGSRYYVKQSKSDKHARNEVLAANLYKLAGIDHADLQLADVGNGKLGTASLIVDGAKPNLGQKLNDPAYKAQAQQGFAVDAWLANWDVAGATFDNIVTDANGKPVRIDPGGSLLFRAQGTPKGAKFGDTVGEWDSLRSPSTNAQSAKLFSGMTPAQMQASAERVTAITPEQIDKAIADAGFTGADAKLLSERLKARRVDVAKRAGLALPGAGPAKPAETPTPAAPAAPAAGSFVSKGEAAKVLDAEDWEIEDVVDAADGAQDLVALAKTDEGKQLFTSDGFDLMPDGKPMVVASPSGKIKYFPDKASLMSTLTPAGGKDSDAPAAGAGTPVTPSQAEDKIGLGADQIGSFLDFASDFGGGYLVKTDTGGTFTYTKGEVHSLKAEKGPYLEADEAGNLFYHPGKGSAAPSAAAPSSTADGPVAISPADAMAKLGLGDMSPYGVVDLQQDADISGYPMAMSPHSKGGIQLYQDLPDIPEGATNVLVANPDGTLVFHPEWNGDTPKDATPAPAPAAPAPVAPAPVAPTTGKPVGVVGFQSKQVNQKELAAALFGPGNDNGATWDGKSKLTVTDPDKAIAALDGSLAGGSTAGQKLTVKAVKSKVAALAAASPSGTSAPDAPSATPTVADLYAGLSAKGGTPGSGGTKMPSAGAAAAALGPNVSKGQMDLAVYMADSNGTPVYLTVSPGTGQTKFTKAPDETPAPPYVKVAPDGSMTYYGADSGTPEAPGVDLPGPPMSAASKKIVDDMAQKIGVTPVELAQLRAGAMGQKSHYATKGADGNAVFHTSSSDAKATGLPYVQVDKNGNYSYHGAGSGNSTTMPKGFQNKPPMSFSGGATTSQANHPTIKAETPYVGDPDGETKTAREARIKAEQAKAVAVAREYAKEIRPNLTAGEIAAVHSYGGNGYSSLNHQLRNPPPTASNKAKAKHLDEAMLKWSTPEPMTVWRGTGGWQPPTGLQPGETFDDQAFVSSSMASNRAFSGTRLEISLPAGFPAVPINGADPKPPHKGELELLLPRGTRFAVVSDEYRGGKRWMKVEAIPPDYLLEAMAA